MCGHHNPLGWAATLLIAVADAHVILEIAAAILVVAVGVRLLLVSPVRHAISGHHHRRFLARPRFTVVIERRPAKRSRTAVSGR
jgi:predicted tellurium resistance membrane protein TerC